MVGDGLTLHQLLFVYVIPAVFLIVGVWFITRPRS